MPLSIAEDAYDEIQFVDVTLDYVDIHFVASNPFSLPSWLGSPPSFDYLL